MSITLKAPAKINWFLSVCGKRSDGYHDIVTLMQSVALFDTLVFEDSGVIELVSDLRIPQEDNLVYKTALLMKKHWPCSRGVRITLAKEIPHAAGLGGGSSDAASTLLALNALWEINASTGELAEIGAEIGSDVPFFLTGNFSVCEGRGEKTIPLKTKRPVVMVLVKPDIEVSTAWAYGSLKTELTKKSFDIKLFCQALDGKDFGLLRNMVFNDLEDAVVKNCHIIAEIKETLLRNGALIASMSGSGPTVFGVFRSEEEAEKASATFGNYWRRVVRTLV